jgi:DHA1 family multidrug resistance protein-like MFS transporter
VAESWQKNQYVTTAMVFVVFLGFAFVLPFLPLYVRELGVSDEEDVALWAGVLIGIAPLLAGVLAPVWGRLADRYGQKRMAVRALVSSMVLLLWSAFVRSPIELLLTRIGTGLFGGVGPLGLAMATSAAPREHTGRAVGMIQSAQILAAAAGPLLGGYLADQIGIRLTFVVTAAICAAALLLVSFFYSEAPALASSSPERRGSFREVVTFPGVPALLVVLFLVNFIGRSFTPILPLHLDLLGVSRERLASSTGVLISAYSLAAALSAALFGRLTRRHSPWRLLVLSLFGGALTVLPMAFVSTFAAFLALAGLLGLASGGALTLSYTIGGLLVPAGQRSTAFGFFSGAALFGGAVSPSAAGLIAHLDLRGIYVADALLFVLLATAFVLGAAPRGENAAASGAGPAEE